MCDAVRDEDQLMWFGKVTWVKSFVSFFKRFFLFLAARTLLVAPASLRTEQGRYSFCSSFLEKPLLVARTLLGAPGHTPRNKKQEQRASLLGAIGRY